MAKAKIATDALMKIAGGGKTHAMKQAGVGFMTGMGNLGSALGGDIGTWGPKVAQSALTGAALGATTGGLHEGLTGGSVFRGIGRGALQGGIAGGAWGMGSAFATRTGVLGGGAAGQNRFGTMGGNVKRAWGGEALDSSALASMNKRGKGFKYHHPSVNTTKHALAGKTLRKAQQQSNQAKDAVGDKVRKLAQERDMKGLNKGLTGKQRHATAEAIIKQEERVAGLETPTFIRNQVNQKLKRSQAQLLLPEAQTVMDIPVHGGASIPMRGRATAPTIPTNPLRQATNQGLSEMTPPPGPNINQIFGRPQTGMDPYALQRDLRMAGRQPGPFPKQKYGWTKSQVT